MTRRVLPCLLLLAMVTACSGGSSASPSPSAKSTAASGSASPAAAPELIFNGAVPVADDRELAAQCWGSGTPTVLLEAGGTRSNMGEWPTAFVTRLAADNTVCLYSRAGGEGSTAPDGLLTYDTVIHDAFALLDWLEQEHGVTGPYVFVGWSFGGSVALAEALEHPESTAGLVILDTDPIDDFLKVCAEAGHSRAECRAEFEGDKEAKAIEAEIVAHEHPLPDIPVAIVSALIFPDCFETAGEEVSYGMAGQEITAPDCRTLAERVADAQAAGWGELLPQLTQTRVEAGHDQLISQAGFKIGDVIQGVIDQAGTGG
jgi:pimeloyl-ACP methyl ester carboxylesterase